MSLKIKIVLAAGLLYLMAVVPGLAIVIVKR